MKTQTAKETELTCRTSKFTFTSRILTIREFYKRLESAQIFLRPFRTNLQDTWSQSIQPLVIQQ